MQPSISIIIPAFNEAQRIVPTLIAYDEHLRRIGTPYEIVVVDDGSSDGTADVVERLSLSRECLRCVRSSPNRGKGHAVRVGMLAAGGSVRVMVDADGSTGPEELAKVVGPVLAGRAAVAIGSRYLDGSQTPVRQPFWRRGWSRLANFLIQRSLVAGIRDTQCGFKAFDQTAARLLFGRATVDGWAFDLEVLALARRLNLEVLEVPVVWNDDANTRIRALKDLFSVAREWWQIRRNLRRGSYRLPSVSLGASST